MSKVKCTDIIACMNDAPSGSFVAITDYEGQDGTVKTVQGQIGVSYETMKANAIAELKESVENESFDEISVSGQGYAKDVNGVMEFGRKSKDRKLINFCETFTPEQVLEAAKGILHDWENPKPRKSNKVQLTEKNDGLSYNTETGSFNFSLVVFREYYKDDKTKQAKAGKEVEVKATTPQTALKKTIREMFEKKYRAFTIAEGKFAKLSIGDQVFLAEDITL